MRPRLAHKAQRRGVAIVLAMGTVALAATAATAIMVAQGTWTHRNQLTNNHAQAQVLILAGTDWARAVLHDDRRTGDIDHLDEPWALRLPSMPVEQGMLSGYMEDQQGRFNLNNLVTDGETNPAQLTHFQRLLSVLGVPPIQSEALVNSLADWIDADGVPRPGGAEDEYYAGLQQPYLTANQPLTDVDELMLVRGFDESIRALLRPFVSALPRSTSVNVNTASPEVLVAIIAGLTLDDARTLVTRRERTHFINSSDFLRSLPENASGGESSIAVSSAYFLVRMRVTINDAESSGAVLLDRQHPGWPTVIWSKVL